MKVLIFIVLIFINSILNANEITIIELHSKKSLDQLVLESSDDNNIEKTDDENSAIIDQETEINNGNTSDSTNEQVNSSSDENLILDGDAVLDLSNLWEGLDPNDLKKKLEKITNVKSEILLKELTNNLSEINLSIESSNSSEIYFIIINKLYEIGEIQKAYKIIKSVDLSKDKNKNFYKSLELNYLLSTYQLDQVCDLKNDLSLEKVNLSNFLLEKTDIFCLILEDKLAEAELLNSLLVEIEKETDIFFQDLYEVLINANKIQNNKQFNSNTVFNENIIFLYSAMMRIAELPLDEKFLKIDPNNLSIPVILSNSTNIKTRLMAANDSYLRGIISIDSLAALYQSVDFTSNQLNNSKKTLESLSDEKEIIMAFYFQLANIQIFPSERLKVLMNFWEFAKKYNAEEIAYALCYNIVSSIDPSIENSEFGSEIAISHIYNKDFDTALKWIIFYENKNDNEEEINKVKFLFDLYKLDEIDTILNYVNSNIQTFEKSRSQEIKELIFVILSVLDTESSKNFSSDFINIFDNRLMPSVFLNSKINSSINSKDDFNLILLLIMSLNDKNWSEIHPEHLKLILKGANKYKESKLLKPLLIEIFQNYKIL